MPWCKDFVGQQFGTDQERCCDSYLIGEVGRVLALFLEQLDNVSLFVGDTRFYSLVLYLDFDFLSMLNGDAMLLRFLLLCRFAPAALLAFALEIERNGTDIACIDGFEQFGFGEVNLRLLDFGSALVELRVLATPAVEGGARYACRVDGFRYDGRLGSVGRQEILFFLSMRYRYLSRIARSFSAVLFFAASRPDLPRRMCSRTWQSWHRGRTLCAS